NDSAKPTDLGRRYLGERRPIGDSSHFSTLLRHSSACGRGGIERDSRASGTPKFGYYTEIYSRGYRATEKYLPSCPPSQSHKEEGGGHGMMEENFRPLDAMDVQLAAAIGAPFATAVAWARTCYSGKGIVWPADVSKDEKAIEVRDRIASSTLLAGHLTTR